MPWLIGKELILALSFETCIVNHAQHYSRHHANPSMRWNVAMGEVLPHTIKLTADWGRGGLLRNPRNIKLKMIGPSQETESTVPSTYLQNPFIGGWETARTAKTVSLFAESEVSLPADTWMQTYVSVISYSMHNFNLFVI